MRATPAAAAVALALFAVSSATADVQVPLQTEPEVSITKRSECATSIRGLVAGSTM